MAAMANKPAPAWLIAGVGGAILTAWPLLMRDGLPDSIAHKLSLVIGLVLLLMVFIRISAGPK